MTNNTYLDIYEKINIISAKLEDLQYIKDGILQYIEKINSGMEDPDYTIKQCENIIVDLGLKISALQAEKEALTNQGQMI